LAGAAWAGAAFGAAPDDWPGDATSGAAGVKAMANAVTTATDARPVATRVLVIDFPFRLWFPALPDAVATALQAGAPGKSAP
jgi:hypothetical protein